MRDDQRYSYSQLINPRLSDDEKKQQIEYCRIEFLNQIVRQLPFNRYFTIRFLEDYRQNQVAPDIFDFDEIRFYAEMMEVDRRDIIIETPIHTYKKIEIDWHKKEWWSYQVNQQKRKIKRWLKK